MGVGQSKHANVRINTALPNELMRQCAEGAPELFIRSPLLGAEFAHFYHLCMDNLSEEKMAAYEASIALALQPLRHAKTTTTSTTTKTTPAGTTTTTTTTTTTEEEVKPKSDDENVDIPPPTAVTAEVVQVLDAKVIQDALDKMVQVNNAFATSFISAFTSIQNATILDFLRVHLNEFGVAEEILAGATAPITDPVAPASVAQETIIAKALDQSVLSQPAAQCKPKRLVEGLGEEFDGECRTLYNILVAHLLRTFTERVYKYLWQAVEPDLAHFPTIKDATNLLPFLDDGIQRCLLKQVSAGVV
jgi:hypothetical protein